MAVTKYFDAFPIVDYKFGDEDFVVPIENLSIYVDIVDQVKRSSSTYQNYDILPDERPDQVSYKLYNTTDYYWTFFLMNNSLRERGWPLSARKVEEFAKREYRERVVTTESNLISNFELGTEIIGTLSSSVGKIIHRDVGLGQIWLDNSTAGLWLAGETINSTNKTPTESIVCLSSELRYQAAHHYNDANGNWADIIPTDARPAGYAEVSWEQRLIKQNDELKSIIVLKPEVISEVVKSFREAIKS